MKRNLYLLALGLAILTAIGYTVGKDYEKEAKVTAKVENRASQVKKWMAQAKNGLPEAQYELGRYYEKDRVDFLNAQKWYRVAATKGQHAGAQFKLAQLYMNGQGVENDLAEAMKWFRQSGAKGDARAQFFLGIANRDGWERKPDYIEAYKWFLLANKNAALVRGENELFDPAKALSELDAKISKFDREQAAERAARWSVR